MSSGLVHRGLSDPQLLALLGNRLRAYREAQDLTLAQLAELAGLSALTLQKAETGGNFTMRTLLRVLRALGKLEQLEAFLPPVTQSPLALLKEQRGD